MTRVINFSPGPSTVPESVLKQAQAELLDWRGTGASVMEVSHRGKPFTALAEHAQATLRRLLSISDDYHVLFLQGGAQMQFAAVPLNISARDGRVASYVNTGSWSSKAIDEARLFGPVHLVASSEPDGSNHVPALDTWDLRDDAAYVHYTPNETIGGVEFHWVPEVGTVPLIADLSSNILSRPVDVSKHGLIYAGAQKNMGIAGVTLVVVHDSLLGLAAAYTPTPINYAVQAKQDSMANTPATFSWYVMSLMLDWIEAQGGVEALEVRNRRKAGLLYSAIDASNFYSNPVAPADRSLMNVTFVLPDPALDAPFLQLTEAAQLSGLKGHRSVGGMRASLYNAMPEEGVVRLLEVMREFERTHG
jgi:phosphoserine aminotransferase